MKKTALITGGSSGLGFAIAKKLQGEGYDLILIARDAAKLERVKCALMGVNKNTKVDLYSCNLADEVEISKTFKDIDNKYQKLDFLVLNAGITTVDLLEDYDSLEEVNRNIKINLLGAISCTYLSLTMLKSGSHVLFVSSGFGLIGPAAYSLYAAAKAGLVNFAESMRRELIRKEISVHVICPGDIDTPMLSAELEVMPGWMKEKQGRGKPQSADNVAAYAIKKCFKNQFMIIPSIDVKFLRLVKRLLPNALYTFLGDRILPLPPK